MTVLGRLLDTGWRMGWVWRKWGHSGYIEGYCNHWGEEEFPDAMKIYKKRRGQISKMLQRSLQTTETLDTRGEVKGRFEGSSRCLAWRLRMGVSRVGAGRRGGGAVLWDEDKLPTEKEQWFYVFHCAKAKQSKLQSTVRQLVCTCPALSTAYSITSLSHTAGT